MFQIRRVGDLRQKIRKKFPQTKEEISTNTRRRRDQIQKNRFQRKEDKGTELIQGQEKRSQIMLFELGLNSIKGKS